MIQPVPARGIGQGLAVGAHHGGGVGALDIAHGEGGALSKLLGAIELRLQGVVQRGPVIGPVVHDKELVQQLPEGRELVVEAVAHEIFGDGTAGLVGG